MPPTTTNAISAGVGLATSAYSLYNGVRKAAQAKRLAANNKRPIYNADGSIQEVVDVAVRELNSNYEKDFTAQQLQQNQMEGIDAILKSGGKADFETIQGTYGKGLQQGLNQIMMSRDRKIANFNNAEYNLAQSKDAEFQYNQDAPFKDMKQQEANLRQESKQSYADAISGVASTVANYGIATMKPGEYGETGAGNTMNRMPTANNEQAPLLTSASPFGGYYDSWGKWIPG